MPIFFSLGLLQTLLIEFLPPTLLLLQLVQKEFRVCMLFLKFLSMVPFSLKSKAIILIVTKKKKLFFKILPWCFYALTLYTSILFPSLCSSHTSLLAACWAGQAHYHPVIFAWIVLPQRMLVPKPFMWWNPHFKILLRDFPGGQVVENLPSNLQVAWVWSLMGN